MTQLPPSQPHHTAHTPSNDGAISRAWQHALHEENVFNDTSNFFLVAEAMLLVFYATLYPHIQSWALLATAVLGLVLTIMWFIINVRQEADLVFATRHLADICDEYKQFRSRRSKSVFRRTRPVLSKGVPIVVGMTWITLVLEQLFAGAPAS